MHFRLYDALMQISLHNALGSWKYNTSQFLFNRMQHAKSENVNGPHRDYWLKDERWKWIAIAEVKKDNHEE